LTTLTVEQVSHHPPITAYHIANASRGVILQGHNAQKTSFSGELPVPMAICHPLTSNDLSGGNIIVKQLGHATLTVSLPDGKKEKYLVTLPRLRIEGLWYGSPYIELTDTSYIQSSSGWLSTIKYQGKGYFSGKSHSFKADLTPPIGSGSNYRASSYEGQWNTTSKDQRTGMPFTDVTGPKEEVTVRLVDEQGEWESRALWCKVAKGIRESDFEAASREKTRIEVGAAFLNDSLFANQSAYYHLHKQNEQRQRRRDEAAAGTTWQLKHFVYQEGDPLCMSRFVSPDVASSLTPCSQTNVWAVCSRSTRRLRRCTSTRIMAPRLTTHELARCNLVGTTFPASPSALAEAVRREIVTSIALCIYGRESLAHRTTKNSVTHALM
jgi:hypothetical protein